MDGSDTGKFPGRPCMGGPAVFLPTPYTKPTAMKTRMIRNLAAAIVCLGFCASSACAEEGHVRGFICFASANAVHARDFVDPPASARPHTWWHWMNGNITREGITADLEAMARVGLGGANLQRGRRHSAWAGAVQ